MKKYLSKTYLLAMLGASIEYYDIALYGYMAPVLVPIFFPFLDTTTSYCNEVPPIPLCIALPSARRCSSCLLLKQANALDILLYVLCLSANWFIFMLCRYCADKVPINVSLIFLSQKVRDIYNSIKIITGSDIAGYAANVK